MDDTVAASHNIGIAMATSHGLVVPNIKNVQRLSVLEVGYLDLRLLFFAISAIVPYCFILTFNSLCGMLQIATEVSRLIQLANTNSLSTDDITGGTITVSNFGAIGGKLGMPILNVPEVAIVAIGRMQQMVRPSEGYSEYSSEPVVNVSAMGSIKHEFSKIYAHAGNIFWCRELFVLNLSIDVSDQC